VLVWYKAVIEDNILFFRFLLFPAIPIALLPLIIVFRYRGIFMQENRYSFSLYTTFLSIGPFLIIGLMFGFMSGCSGNSKQANASNKSVSGQKNIAELPKIGEIVTTESALELCEYYGFNYLAKRIEDNPDHFKEWKFDGCSMTPTEVVSELIKVPTLVEICLKHDLGYAYGDPGNEEERLRVDQIFQNGLLDGGASEFAAKTMFDAVRAGGKEKLCLSFSWGFARVATCKVGVGLMLKE
jgi:hypothetical protein